MFPNLARRSGLYAVVLFASNLLPGSQAMLGQYRKEIAKPSRVRCRALTEAQHPQVEEIIRKSVVQNEKDFEAAPHFNWKERDRTVNGIKVFQVTMIDGTPYNRLIALNGKALSSQQERRRYRSRNRKQSDAKRNRPPLAASASRNSRRAARGITT